MAADDLPEGRVTGVTGVQSETTATIGEAGRAVRRLVVFTLLFVTVTIAAIGLSGLVGRTLDVADQLASDDVGALAQALAFTLVSGPIAAVLWFFIWRGLADRRERQSIAWGLYLAVMSTVAIITASTSLLLTVASLVGGVWQPQTFASGTVWAGVWAWHRWMRRHPLKGATMLTGVAPVIAYVYGIIIGAGGAVTCLGTLFDVAILGGAGTATIGDPWWQLSLEGLVWAVGGGAIWWWHWAHGGARMLRDGLAAVAIVLVAGLGAVLLTLSGMGAALFALLRLAFDRDGAPASEVLDPLGTSVAAAAVGAVIWAYYRRVAAAGTESVRLGTGLVTSGIGLIAAASGIGVVVNSLLAAAGTPLAESGTRTLLLGGVSALVVGAPVWWLSWKPATPVAPDSVGSTARRVYLIAIFGVSAVVALITLLVIGFRVFEFALDSVTTASLLDRVRAPLGLLASTLLVAGYHFAVWTRDRAAAPAATQRRTIGRITLVGAADAGLLADAVREATGAPVVVWHRAVPSHTGPDVGSAAGGPSAAQLAHALDGVAGARVLIITGPGGRIEVIPLEN